MSTRIAHISDIHILEPSRSFGFDTRFVSFGRPLDAQDRVRKLQRAVATGRRAGATHFVMSGDLTEVGTPAQFEAFAGGLHDAGLRPGEVTLVPGNHDAYTAVDGWSRALAGPLRPFASHAAQGAGRVLDLGDAYVLPVDVTRYQSIARSAGELRDDTATALERRLADPALGRKPVLIVQHHPPYDRGAVWQWVDGLIGYARVFAMMLRHPNVHMFHGHLHRAVDRIVDLSVRAASSRGHGRARIFGAPAVVDDEASPRVRLYDVRGGEVESIGLA